MAEIIVEVYYIDTNIAWVDYTKSVFTYRNRLMISQLIFIIKAFEVSKQEDEYFLASNFNYLKSRIEYEEGDFKIELYLT